MAYGFEVRDSGNNLMFSSEDSTFTLLGTYLAPANTTVSFVGVPTMPTRIFTRHMIAETNGDNEAYVHTVTLNNNILTATAPSSTDTFDTFIMVFGK